MHHLIFVINCLSHFVSLELINLLMMSHFLVHFHLFTTFTIHHTFTILFQAQNSSFQQIFSTGLTHLTGLNLSCSTVFYVLFLFLFLFLGCMAD